MTRSVTALVPDRALPDSRTDNMNVYERPAARDPLGRDTVSKSLDTANGGMGSCWVTLALGSLIHMVQDSRVCNTDADDMGVGEGRGRGTGNS